MKEEIGLTVTSIRFLDIYSDHKRHPREAITLSYTIEVEGEPKARDDAEEYAFVPLNALHEKMTSDHKNQIEFYLHQRQIEWMSPGLQNIAFL